MKQEPLCPFDNTAYIGVPDTGKTKVALDVPKLIKQLDELYDKNDYYHWAITLKENGDKPIGTIHGLVNDDLEQVTVGYCLGQAWWHQGIMSEALQAVIDFFFDRVGPNSICSYHDPNNPHSGMVMKHCGMKYEGTRRAADRNNTGICDASWYSILRSEH